MKRTVLHFRRFLGPSVGVRAARFGRDASGAVALMFALALGVVFTTVGVAVDYSRVSDAKAKLQLAADSAALAAARDASTTTMSQRQETARQVVAAQFHIGPATVTETEPAIGAATSYVVQATADIPLYFGGLVGMKSAQVGAQATAMAASNNDSYEIALALDNTGSMATVINDLRTAAGNFVNTVMTSPNVKVSVVPYVAAVNPGITDTTMIDTKMDSAAHADWIRGSWVAYGLGCTPSWFGGGGSGGSGPGSSSSGDVGGSAIDMMEILNPFRRFAGELFGISSAHAQSFTPNTIAPLATTTVVSPTTGKTYQIPPGFKFVPMDGTTGGCDFLANPWEMSHYDLHNRIMTTSGAMSKWKGCVEARPTAAELAFFGKPVLDDYDVKEIPPNAADPSSLFVPYFWPDEPDWNTATLAYSAPQVYSSAAGGYHNNYLPDFAWPAAWNWWNTDKNDSGDYFLKYDGATPAVIKETWPNTVGPNASCPDEVLRLTSNKSAVTTKIAGLGYWYNGGTVISEGLMWGWRTLSPNKPYGDGKAYGTANNNKVIVLMTDGVNGLATSADSNNISDYSAYGYLGANRLKIGDAITSFDQLAGFLDARTIMACTNAKAAGVKIYTILFNHGLDATQTARSVSLLTQCATQNNFFYHATDLTSLNSAFSSIAGGIGRLRLVK